MGNGEWGMGDFSTRLPYGARKKIAHRVITSNGNDRKLAGGVWGVGEEALDLWWKRVKGKGERGKGGRNL